MRGIGGGSFAQASARRVSGGRQWGTRTASRCVVCCPEDQREGEGTGGAGRAAGQLSSVRWGRGVWYTTTIVLCQNGTALAAAAAGQVTGR